MTRLPRLFTFFERKSDERSRHEAKVAKGKRPAVFPWDIIATRVAKRESNST